MRKVPKNFKCNMSVKTKNKLGLKIGVEEIEENFYFTLYVLFTADFSICAC